MSDEKKTDTTELPTETAFALRTRTLIKMGVPFDDSRMQMALTQLYLWPQLLFEPQQNEEGKYLVEVRINEADHVVDFNLMLVTVPKSEELKTRSERLVAWCQQLLGEDWLVNIVNREKPAGKYRLLFKGDRLRPSEARPATMPDAPFPEAVTKFRQFCPNEKRLKRDDDLLLGPILPVDTKR